jgi:hypothetical protein
MSLTEIGPDLMSEFVCMILLALVEQKKESIEKTWRMVNKKIRADFLPEACLKAGYKLSLIND